MTCLVYAYGDLLTINLNIMTNEQKNIEKQFNGLLMDLDLTDEQAENIQTVGDAITYLESQVQA